MEQSDYNEFGIGISENDCDCDDESIKALEKRYGAEFESLELREVEREIDGKDLPKKIPLNSTRSSCLSVQQIEARQRTVEEFLLKKKQTQLLQPQDNKPAIPKVKNGLTAAFNVPMECSREVGWLAEITGGEERTYFQIMNSFVDWERITYFCIWLPARKAIVAITPSYLTTVVLKEVKDPSRYTWLNSQWINGKVKEGTAFRIGKIPDKEQWQEAMKKLLFEPEQQLSKSSESGRGMSVQVKSYQDQRLDVSKDGDLIGNFQRKQESRIDGLKQIFAQKGLDRLINLAKTESDQQAVLEIIRGLKNQGYTNLELAEALGTKIDEELEVPDIFEAVNLMFPVNFEKRRKTTKEDFINQHKEVKDPIEKRNDFLVNKTTEPEIPMNCQILARNIKDVFATEKIQNRMGEMGQIEFSEMNKTVLDRETEELQQIKNYLFWIKEQEILLILRGKKEEIDSKGYLLVKSLKNMSNETKYFWLDEWLTRGLEEEEGIPVTDDSLIEVAFEEKLGKVLLEAKMTKNNNAVISD